MKFDDAQLVHAKQAVANVNKLLADKGLTNMAFALKLVKNSAGEDEYFFTFELPEFGVQVVSEKG